MTSRDALIIPAAGHGDRFGRDKLTEPLLGEPLYVRTLKAVAPHFDPDRRFIAVAPDRMQEFLERMAALPADCRAIPVPGGETRFLSVYAALRQLPSDTRITVVHDCARPLVTASLIRRCIEAAVEFGAAVAAHPSTDTIKEVDASHTVQRTPDRRCLWAAETPQAARTELFLKGFELCQTRGIIPTDDVQTVELLGHPVHIVSDPDPNPKVTFPADLWLAETLLQQSQQRTP